ncbi:MAG: hypothetical protein K2K97_01115 [Muribaculaceae bacterium]|nr:hypothetical protein [Muribaculaceae bacterium]
MKIFNMLHEKENPFANETPLWMIMPDSAIVRSGNPFFVPDFDDKFEAFPALAVRLDRLGKSVAPRFAYRYYNEMTAAVTVRASGLLRKLRDAAMPWDRAVIFDKSCFLGNYINSEEFFSAKTIDFRIGEHQLSFPLEEKKESIDTTISAISRENIIKMGDILLIPLTSEGFELHPQMDLSALINENNLLDIRIK